MKKKIILEIIVGAFVLLFMYAGLSKLFILEGFGRRIEATLHTTHFIGKSLGVLLIVAEIVTALAFFKNSLRLLALWSSLILMTIFTVYIASILSFAEHVPCSCGGILQNMSWTTHLIFNIVFIALALTGIVLEKRNSTNFGEPLQQRI